MNTESRFPLVFSHPHFGREGYILFAPSIGEARREVSECSGFGRQPKPGADFRFVLRRSAFIQ